MRDTLRDFYNGKIIPCDWRTHKNDELHGLVREIDEEEKYFTSKMTADDCARFKKLSNLYSMLSDLEEREIFVYSFTLGARLILDILDEAEKMEF